MPINALVLIHLDWNVVIAQIVSTFEDIQEEYYQRKDKGSPWHSEKIILRTVVSQIGLHNQSIRDIYVAPQ